MFSKSVIEIDVGVPPNAPSDWETRVFHFHGFEQLPSKKGDYTVTPKFRFCGHVWYLCLCPGGDTNSQDDHIGLFLRRPTSEGRIDVEFKFSIFHLDGDIAMEVKDEKMFNNEKKGWGYPDFMQRSKIMSSSNSILKDGTLSISLMMRPTLGTPKTFIPSYNFANYMSALFDSPQHADIMFVVQSTPTEKVVDGTTSITRENEESQEATESFEVGQLTSAKNLTKDEKSGKEYQIYAHRLVLQSCAPGLAMLCEPYANMTPIPIEGVNLASFKLVLKYVYGIRLQYSDWQNHSKELMDAADRFGMTHLKLEAEAWFVLFTCITSENALELLQYADAKTFPLLKEAVMKYLLKNKIEAQQIILSSDNFTSSKTLIVELFGVMGLDGSTNAPGPGEADSKYRAMDVDSLRRESFINRLDFDGQREYLISNLVKVATGDV